MAVFAIVFFVECFCSMPGGPRDIDKNDHGVKNALDLAVNQHNNRRNDMYRSEVVEVVKAQSQVVAGLKYFITAKMTRTNCRKGRTNEVCGPMDAEQTYECTFTVWSRPWLNEINVLEEKCAN